MAESLAVAGQERAPIFMKGFIRRYGTIDDRSHNLMTASRRSGDYLPALDALRAFAVTAVVIEHSRSPEWTWATPVGAGGLGVKIFFVLSGFLITRILLRERLAAGRRAESPMTVLRRFYARRALRILPLFYAVLLTLAVTMPVEIHESLPWHLAYAGNFFNAVRGEWLGPASHFWSLAVEEQFYLLWPLVVLLVPVRALPGVLMAAIAIGPLSRFVAFAVTGNTVAPFVLPTSCFDSLGAGALLAWCHTTGWTIRREHAFAAVAGSVVLYLALVMLAWSAPVPVLDIVSRDILLSIFAFGLIHCLVEKQPAMLSWAPLTYVGSISYGIYAWHYPLALNSTVDRLGTLAPFLSPGWPRFAFVWIAAVAVASLSWRVLERPILRLKSKFDYLRPDSPARVPSQPAYVVASSTHEP
jgi:peptidoglycan/LPS O-acetylase OafA/YrhL